MKAETCWRCCECDEIHDDEYDAIECCQPRISMAYACSACKSIYDEFDEAEECCQIREGEEQLSRPKPEDLEKAGQARLF